MRGESADDGGGNQRCFWGTAAVSPLWMIKFCSLFALVWGGRAPPPPPPICASKWMLMFLILHTVCLYCFYLGTQRSRARFLGCSVSVLASPATLLVSSLSRLNRLPKFMKPAPAAPACLRTGSHISNWLLRCDGAADEVPLSHFFLRCSSFNWIAFGSPPAPQKRNSCFTRAHLPVIYFLLRS